MAVFAAVIGNSAIAAAQTHADEHAGGPPKAEARDAPEVVRRLWHELTCQCGRCARLRLAECPCPDAAAERKKILERVRGLDLSSSEGEERAYREVVAEYVGRYGEAVLATEEGHRHRHVDPVMVGLLAVAFAGAGILAVLSLTIWRHPQRRQRRKGGRR